MGGITKPEEDSKEFYLNEKGSYTTKTKFYVDYINYDDKKNITDLIIRDHKGNIRYEQLTPDKAKEKNKVFQELKKLIETNEDKDDNFNREDFYKYFNVKADCQLNSKQIVLAIKLLKERLK